MCSPAAHVTLKSELRLCNSKILAVLAWRLLFFRAHIQLALTLTSLLKKYTYKQPTQRCHSRAISQKPEQTKQPGLMS